MSSTYITITLILTYLILAIVSLSERQYAKALYWFGGGVLTVGVLLMK